MSAIFGLFSLNGRPVDVTIVARMAETLAHRGPNGADLWYNGYVGLGHMPPLRRQPIPSLGPLVIAADARLDNREWLCDRFAIPRPERAATSDSQLILLAYERWGSDCVEKLLGDFAFVLWDAREQMLFCARDHIGVRPFYYTVHDGAFYWASEIKALHTATHEATQTAPRPNDAQIGAYLVGFSENGTATFFEDIYRLPPAHTLTVSTTGAADCEVRCRRYWQLDWQFELKLSSDQAYAEAFLDLLQQAVAGRLQDAPAAGAFLSGGLDSSAVACVAERALRNVGLPLHTFTTVYNTVSECDERQYSNLVLATGNFEALSLVGDAESPLAEIDSMLRCMDEPFFAPGLQGTWQRLRVAGERQIRLLFEGHGGDEMLYCTARNRLHELAQRRDWPAFGQELHAASPLYRAESWRVAWPYLHHYAWRHSAGTPTAKRPPSSAPLDLLNPDFVRETGLRERYNEWQQSAPPPGADARYEHWAVLANPEQAAALEVLNKAAAFHQVTLVFPLLDKRLLEFCLSLPSAQKFWRNWDRIVFRRAMHAILPVEIQWRRHKTEFSRSLAHSLHAFAGERLRSVFLSPGARSGRYVDGARAEALYNKFSADQGRVDNHVLFPLWRVTVLDCWLRHHLPVTAAHRLLHYPTC